MIAPEFLALLVCPVSHEPLREASAEELARVNTAIAAGAEAAGGLRDRGGTAVTAPVEAGLCTAGGAWLYPIRDGLPVLLGPSAIPVPSS